MILLYKTVILVMSCYVLVHCIRTISVMDFKTNNLVRIVFIVLSTFSFYEVVMIVNGGIPGIAESLSMSCISMSLWCDDRNNFNGNHYQNILR